MKKLQFKTQLRMIFLIVGLILGREIVLASPVLPETIWLEQPNGYIFEAVTFGDEWGAGYEYDGYTIVQDSDGYWVYAELTDLVNERLGGESEEYIYWSNQPVIVRLAPSAVRVGEAWSGQKGLRQPDRIVFGDKGTPYSGAQGGIGDQPVLILLVEFNDQGAVGTTAWEWHNQLFGPDNSVKGWYQEASYGQFSFLPATENYGVANDGVVGWLHVGLNHPVYPTGSDEQAVVQAALTAANPYVNFSSFDTNGDGNIQMNELHLVIVNAGFETAFGGTAAACMPSSWAHHWSFGTGLLLDGVRVGQYNVGGGYVNIGEWHAKSTAGACNSSNGNMSTIGPIVHELGHDIGWPDLYDTDGSSSGVGIWSGMGYGVWGRDIGAPAGSSPTQVDPYSKWYQGWITPTQMSAEMVGLDIVPSTVAPDIYYFDENLGGIDWQLGGTVGSGEFFIVENRQQIGFDIGLAHSLGAGVGGCLIWHIDESRPANNSNNDDENWKHVDLVEATPLFNSELDSYINVGDGNDVWPGDNNLIRFDNGTDPSSNYYQIQSGETAPIVWLNHINGAGVTGCQLDFLGLPPEPGPDPIVCNGAPIRFEAGIPTDWTVSYNGNVGWKWDSTAVCGMGGIYGASICSNPPTGGGNAGWSRVESSLIDMSGFDEGTLSFALQFDQQTNSWLKLDVWNGSSWVNESSWTQDQIQPITVTVDMNPYAGLNDVRVRFVHSSGVGNRGESALVDQLSLSCSNSTVPATASLTPTSLSVPQGGGVLATYYLSLTNELVATNSLSWNIWEGNGSVRPKGFGDFQTIRFPSAENDYFLTGAVSGTPASIARNYLYAQHILWGLNGLDIADLDQKQYMTEQTGTTHVEMGQRMNGIDIQLAHLLINVAADGAIVNAHNRLISDIAGKINVTAPSSTPAEAVVLAAELLDLPLDQLVQVGTEIGAEQKTIFAPSGLSLYEIPVRLSYIPVGQSLRLAWLVEIAEIDHGDWWLIGIDTESGVELSRFNYTVAESFGAGDQDEQLSLLEVTGAESSEQVGTEYRVFPMPIESPNHGTPASPSDGRVLVTNPEDLVASPFGWHDDDGIAGAEWSVTKGNNVTAYVDPNNINPTDGSNGPNCTSSLICDFNYPINLGAADPTAYSDASVANLFYWTNLMHDVWYQYGFDESSGNFQQNNYGKGGVGNDRIYAEAQDSHLLGVMNNANFATPADGSSPRMQIYLWDITTPRRDGAFDAGLIAHEYGHGVSNRLTGGSSVTCLTNMEQMGEGWSDWMSLMMTIQAGDVGSKPRGIGTYLLGEPTTGVGFRPTQYSTDFAINGDGYGVLPGQTVPHGVGYIWSTVLWEINWALIEHSPTHPGLDLDIYNGSGGNNLAMQLVIDGMKLQPCQPGMVDGRDAILAADQLLTGGANECVLWEAFARRGLGLSASQGSSDSITDGTAAYDLPSNCLPTLQISKSSNSFFVEAGGVVTYTISINNQAATTINTVVISDTVQANQEYLINSANCVPFATINEVNALLTFELGDVGTNETVDCTYQVIVNPNLSSTDLFSDDMESGGSSWLTSGPSNSWILQAGPGGEMYGAQVWFGENIGSVSDQYLEMGSPLLLSGNPILSVWHQYKFEAGYDGGVIELSVDGGGWIDLGEEIYQNGYNALLSNDYSNPLGGRFAFTGDSVGYQNSLINLSAYVGQQVKIRFRLGTDISVGDVGWHIDYIEIFDQAQIGNQACVSAVGVANLCDDLTMDVLPASNSAGPIIYLSPISVTQSQQSDLIYQRGLTMMNVGDQPLVWTVAEDATIDCNAPVDIPWINNISLESGTLFPAGSQLINFLFDSTGMVPGDYDGRLCIESNDLSQPLLVVDLTLIVEEPLPCSYVQDISWVITEEDYSSGVIEPGATTVIPIWVDTTLLSNGSYEESLCIETNDPENSLIIVPVTVLVDNSCNRPSPITGFGLTVPVGLGEFSWADSGGDRYELHRADRPFFTPIGNGLSLIKEIEGVSFVDTTGTNHFQNPAINDYYYLLAEANCGSWSIPSNQVAIFDFAIVAGN